MINHLTIIYIDPHKTLNVYTGFKKLIMRPSSTFHGFYTKFLHLASDSKIPLEDYCTELYNKLTLDLQKAILPTYGSMKTYRQLTDQCLLLDRELKRIKEHTDRIQNRQSSSQATTKSAIVTATAKPISTPQPTPRLSTPMDCPRPTYDSADQ